MTLLNRLGIRNKKKKKTVKPEPIRTDCYTLAEKAIAEEKEEEEKAKKELHGNNAEDSQELEEKVLDITAFQDTSNISFLDQEYSSKINKSLFNGGFKKAQEQLKDLKDEYIGHANLGKISTTINGDVSLETAELFDKIFMNNLFYKSLEGRLKESNGFKFDYKEFHKKYLKKNGSEISYEKRKKVFDSFETLSGWVSGQDVEEIKKDVSSIDAYLTEEIKEDAEINKLDILGKRKNNLFRQYDEEISDKKGTYHEFPLLASTIDNVLDSHWDLGTETSKENLIFLHNDLTEKYARVHENGNIADSLKKEADKLYLETARKIHSPTYGMMANLGVKLVETENPEERKSLISKIGNQISLLNEIPHLHYQEGKVGYLIEIPNELCGLVNYMVETSKAYEKIHSNTDLA